MNCTRILRIEMKLPVLEKNFDLYPSYNFTELELKLRKKTQLDRHLSTLDSSQTKGKLSQSKI
ncbi:hypothetical protein QR98_0017730 [Sarcoptes scabiei]|uniref:Uncharacterized protein n=1 Tax=Sarcoptes scabiei TaxID=52283 RepID=A0A131ZWW8_SARSC|nr:hypothetical protein QR98_0017730 [Sarcoptes scabiei]